MSIGARAHREKRGCSQRGGSAAAEKSEEREGRWFAVSDQGLGDLNDGGPCL